MERVFIVVLFLVLLALTPERSYAQEKETYDYNTEFIWGINKNSAGGLIGGFVFKHSRRMTERMFQSFGLEIMNVKHPNEVRRTSALTGNFFIFGKSNYLYAFRFQYGREVIFFKKAPYQGVEIKGVLAGGPSIGLQAPYYIEVGSSGTADRRTTRVQYDPNEHNFSNILGTGRLFQGLGESDIKLGANLKAALNFELGTVKSHVTGFEVGFLFDHYFSDVVLMPTAGEKSSFPQVFITLFYGSRK